MTKKARYQPKLPPLPERGAIKLDRAMLARSAGQAALSPEVIKRERSVIARMQPELAIILSGVLVSYRAHAPEEIEPWIRGITTAHCVVRTGCPDYAPKDGHALSALALSAIQESLFVGVKAGLHQEPFATTLTGQLEVGLLPGLRAETQLAHYIEGFPDQSPAFLVGAGLMAVAIGYDLHAQQSAPGSAH
jgi:hypothetical protein